MKTITPLHSPTRLNPVIVERPVFDLPTAISSGAINEQQLISVLTEMCRCVLAAQQTPSLLIPASTGEAETVALSVASPVAA